jgi:hypothetical protein
MTSFTLHPAAPRMVRKSSRENEAQTMRRASVILPLKGSVELGSSTSEAIVPTASRASRALPSSADGRSPERNEGREPPGARAGGPPLRDGAGAAGSIIASSTCTPLTPSFLA